MTDEKILMMIDELGNLISDWRKVDSLEVTEQISKMIIAKAAELIELTRQIEPDANCGCLCDECEDCNFGRYFKMLVTANKLLKVMTEEQKKALATVIVAGTSSPDFEELQAIIKKICKGE